MVDFAFVDATIAPAAGIIGAVEAPGLVALVAGVGLEAELVAAGPEAELAPGAGYDGTLTRRSD